MQVIHHLGEGFIQDLVDIRGGGQGGGQVVEQRQVFIAAGEGAVALDELAVQARIGDGDRRVGGQRLDHLLVLGGELGGVELVGQVNLPELALAHADGHAQEGVHRRVVGREAGAVRVVG